MLTPRSYEEYQLHSLQLAITKLSMYHATKATIHHADFSRHRVLGKAGTGDDDEAVIEYLYQWHVRENGWQAPGYHGVILPDGRFLLLYRGLKAMKGAHTRNHNSGNLGILVWGDFNEEFPTKAQEETIQAVKNLLETICKIERFFLHRDLNDTTCPGENFPVELWKP